MTPGPKFIREARERFEQHARLRQSNCLRRSDPAGVDSAPPLPLRLTRFYRGSDVKRFPKWRRCGAGLARGRTATPAQSMPTQRKQRVAREQNRSRISHDHPQQNFFSLKAGRRTHRRGAPAPLTTAAGGRSLPIRQARPQPHAGRQACGLPPASQHDAVCGGGANPTVTASCCDGGLGGDRHA